MRPIVSRVSVLGFAVLMQGLIRSAPPAERTWLEWVLRRSADVAPQGSRWSGVLPLVAGVAVTRLAGLLGRWRPARPGWGSLALLLKAGLLAVTFDAFRGIRNADRLHGALARGDRIAAADLVRGWAGQDVLADEESLVAEAIGQMAIAPAASVAGPWTAYAVFDLPGALGYSLAESVRRPAGLGVLSPLAGALRRDRHPRWARELGDEAVALATLVAAGTTRVSTGQDWRGRDADADLPLPVVVTARVLGRQLSWRGHAVNQSAPAPDREDLRRARRLTLRVLSLLAGAAAVLTVAAATWRHRFSAPTD